MIPKYAFLSLYYTINCYYYENIFIFCALFSKIKLVCHFSHEVANCCWTVFSVFLNFYILYYIFNERLSNYKNLDGYQVIEKNTLFSINLENFLTIVQRIA